MDDALTLIHTTYQYFFNRLRLHALGTIEAGDVSLNDLRNQLEKEFEVINRKLDLLSNAPVQAAMTHMKDALVTRDSALRQAYFLQANSKAIDGFQTHTRFEGKILAIKIRILCSLHLHGYFNYH